MRDTAKEFTSAYVDALDELLKLDDDDPRKSVEQLDASAFDNLKKSGW